MRVRAARQPAQDLSATTAGSKPIPHLRAQQIAKQVAAWNGSSTNIFGQWKS